MNSTSKTPSMPLSSSQARPRAGLVQRMVQSRLARIHSGQLVLLANGQRHAFGSSASQWPTATIQVEDPRFWRSVAFRGSVGAGESYAKGWWTSDSPTDVVRLFARNQSALSGLEGGLAVLSRPVLALYHGLRRNNESGSQNNIRAHYDLSNEFFALFLDPSMTYSCGYYAHAGVTLEEASLAKIDRLCQKLQLQAGDHLLEIGTGWGAFAIHAASKYGCRVTTTTISKEQHSLAAKRIQAAGLGDRVTLLLEDYRKLEGQFDKLVSVEMIEAVGAAYYPEFFRTCGRLLKPGGTMALQAITIADQNYESARRSVDFIQRHIFPGSCIPSVTALCSAMTQSSELRLVDLEDIGPHYVKTLKSWRENLLERHAEARDMGHSEEFLRLWEFYFAYCEGAFAERNISDVHMLLQGPGTQPPSAIPGRVG